MAAALFTGLARFLGAGSRVGDVVADLRGLAAEPTTEKADRVALVKTGNYMKKRELMMGYKELLAAGAPIATGIIDGACRHLVCDRMEITGARWSLATAEAVLQLRTLISSGDFEAYWSWHERAERHRNHDVHYAESRPPALETLTISMGLRVVKRRGGLSLQRSLTQAHSGILLMHCGIPATSFMKHSPFCAQVVDALQSASEPGTQAFAEPGPKRRTVHIPSDLHIFAFLQCASMVGSHIGQP